MKLKPIGDSRPSASARESGVRLRYCGPLEPELDGVQLSAALDCADNALLIVDRFGWICAANTRAAALLGAAPEQIRQTYVQSYLAALDHRDGVFQAATAAPNAVEVTLPDGRPALVALEALPNRDGEATHICVTIRPEVTARRDAALEAAYRLVAELAHDINNQLSAALNYVFILRRRLSADAQLAPHLEELHATAWRAAALTAGLKLLGPKRIRDLEQLDLAEVLGALSPVLDRVTDRCPLTLRLVPGLPRVTAARGHLEQLLVMATLSAVNRACGRGSIKLGLEPRGPHKVRVVWELEPNGASSAHAMRPSPAAAQGHAALRRALKRCAARPGHDDTRIWVDLPAGT